MDFRRNFQIKFLKQFLNQSLIIHIHVEIIKSLKMHSKGVWSLEEFMKKFMEILLSKLPKVILEEIAEEIYNRTSERTPGIIYEQKNFGRN